MPWYDSLVSRFRRKEEPSKPTSEELRRRLEDSRALADSLHKRMKKRCEQLQKARREAADAKEQGQKATSMFYLRHSHMIEQDQKNLQGQLLNVTKSVHSLEQALMSTETMNCLRGTADTLQNANDGHVLDGADDAAEDFEDACETTAEFAEALSVPIGDHKCDEDLESEFSALGPPASAARPTAAEPAALAPTMPEAPTHALPVVPRITKKLPASLRDMEKLAAQS